MAHETIRNLINGEWVAARSGKTTKNINPATGESIGEVVVSGREEAEAAVRAWKLAPALVCGNTIVLKPASITPWCAKILAEAFTEAGLPPGVLNVVFGPGSSVGDTLVTHSDVAAISFTGSNEVGSKLYA